MGKHGERVITSSYHQTLEFTLWLQEFQTMYAWNISVIRTLLHCWRISRFSYQNMALINCRYMYIIKVPYVHMQYRPDKTQRLHQSKPQKLTPCLLCVRSGSSFFKICVSSKSAMVYSGSALGVRFTHCSVVQTHHFSYHLDLRVYFWNRGLLSMSTLDQPGGRTAWGQLWGDHSRPKADTEHHKTQKTDPKFGWGLL